MKIAITGHSAGIGQALATLYEQQGHEIVGLSRRTGFNIRNIPKVVDQIAPCDMFINNAQIGFAQTELLFEVFKQWQGQPKLIMVISSMMTQRPVSVLPGLDMDLYWLQKKTLEEACVQLRHKATGPGIILVKPGAVATQPNQESPRPYADVNEWAETLIKCLNTGPNLVINEIALGVYRGS